MIVIECKRYTRPVGIEKVEAFATKVRDVNGHQGVMVSAKGFDAGARAAAAEANIGLWTYHDAAEADWHALMGPNAWATLTISTLEDLSGVVRTKRPPNLRAEDPTILNEKGEKLFTLAEVKDAEGNRLLLKAPGTYRQEIGANVPMFIRMGNDLYPVEAVYLQATNRAREYVFNTKLGGGHVLKRTVPDSGAFRQLHSEPWRADEIMRTQAGRELSAEEWRQRQGPPPAGHQRIIDRIVRYPSMRFRLTVMHDDSAIKRADS
jgi:hypothetical protein